MRVDFRESWSPFRSSVVGMLLAMALVAAGCDANGQGGNAGNGNTAGNGTEDMEKDAVIAIVLTQDGEWEFYKDAKIKGDNLSAGTPVTDEVAVSEVFILYEPTSTDGNCWVFHVGSWYNLC